MHEHKKQLHERIMKRHSQLQAQLEQMESVKKATRSEREIALADALATLEIHTATGWDHVGETEAAELSRWLDSNQFLVDDSQTDERAEAIFNRLETNWKLQQYGIPAQE